MNELTNKMNLLISKFIDPNQQHNGVGETSPRLTSSNGNHNMLLLQQQQQQNKPKLKYKNWCGQVEKKANSIIVLMPQLDSLAANEEKKREKSVNSLTKVNTALLEMICMLEIIAYKPSTKSTNIDNTNGPSDFSLSGSGGIPPPSPTSQTNGSNNNSSSPSSSNSNSPNITSPPVSINSSNGINSQSSSVTSAASPSSLTSSGSFIPSSPPDQSSAGGGGLINTFINLKERDQNSAPKSTKIVTMTCRETLIQLWGTLLVFVEKFASVFENKDFSLFYKTILLIARRKEFDTAVSPLIDPLTFKPWSPDILIKYRVKLYKTFSFIANIITTTPFLNLPLSQFCAKFIVIGFFRIPKIAKLLLDALTPPETEIKDIINYYPCPQHLQHLRIIGDRPDKLPFHSLLMQYENCEKEIDNIPQGWVDNLARKENIFFIFFKEWITVCKYVLGDSVDLRTVPGYFTLIYALLHEIKSREQSIPPQQAKATPSLDAHFTLINATKSVDPLIFDAMVKILFLKTCIFDFPSVASTLSIVELWIKEYGVLPDTFDINFFCEGIDNIIAADHHQVLIRSLNLIYNTSDAFQGTNRRVLFCDLLLHKYFYQLFLHWDQPVRNAYHHILLYRMVRIKRSELYQSGFSIAEFSKLTHNNTIATNKTLSPTKYPEKDEKSDHSYNSSSRLQSSTASISINSKPRPSISSSTAAHSGTPLPTSTLPTTTKKVPPPVPPRNMSLTLSTQNQEDANSNETSNESYATDLDTLSTYDDPLPAPPAQQPQSPTQKIVELAKYSKEFSIDLELFTNIEVYIKNVSDQFRTPELKHHDPRLTNYVAPSLSEFKTYIAINNQVNSTPPKIIPLMAQGPTPLNFLKD